ncbi:MAG: hydantoinase B/oxoprolinase family protein [Pseudomonadota bacterium]
MSTPHQPLDAVTMELLWTRLISIVDEAAKAIVRTSFSTLANEANDFACVLTDSRGFALAQNSGSIPSFIATLPKTVRHFIDVVGIENMRDGDLYCTNDPWHGTGHLSDVCLAKPLFHRGRLVAFAATTSHVPDIGGRLRALESRQVFEEGLQIPVMKFLSEGEPDKTLVTLIRTNVRTPDQTLGDIWAQIGACELMNERIQPLMRDYSLEDLRAFGDSLFEKTEAAMRAQIAALPDGTYTAGFETDGFDEPLTFKAALTVSGDSIEVDYSGCSPTQPRAINCVMAYTYAMTAYALKCALLPDIPNNEGMYRPITVSAPEDTIVNPQFPAAVVARSNTGHYLPPLIYAALQNAIPDRVMAATGSPLWIFTITGLRDDGSTFANVLFYNGGMGATSAKDGENAMSYPSNISSTPVEICESNGPLFCHFKRLRPGSGGHGERRGGLGQDIMFECTSEKQILAMFMTERVRFGAPGIAGGAAGEPGTVLINGEPVDVHKQHPISKGDKVLLRTPGGGGFGDPSARHASASKRDVQLGYST